MNMNKGLEKKLKQDFKKALLAGERGEAEAINYLVSLLQRRAEKSLEGKLSPEQQVAILQKELKKKQEAKRLYSQGNRQDLAEKEKKEIKLLQRYLPKTMGQKEIVKLVEAQIAGETDFGQVMGKVMAQVKGRADGALVARLVHEALDKRI